MLGLVTSDPLRPFWTVATRLLCPWDFPGKNTGACCHFFLWGIFPPKEQTCISSALQVDCLPAESLGKPIVKLTDLKTGRLAWIFQVSPIESLDSLKAKNFLQLEARAVWQNIEIPSPYKLWDDPAVYKCRSEASRSTGLPQVK